VLRGKAVDIHNHLPAFMRCEPKEQTTMPGVCLPSASSLNPVSIVVDQHSTKT
jgi:hypothetical protein